MGLSRSGLALLTVIILVILISIVAIASINLMVGQALLIEHQIARLRTIYTVEAALQLNLLWLASGTVIQDPTFVGPYQVRMTQTPGNGPLATDTLRVNLDY